jgi:hypothetical protein
VGRDLRRKFTTATVVICHDGSNCGNRCNPSFFFFHGWKSKNRQYVKAKGCHNWLNSKHLASKSHFSYETENRDFSRYCSFLSFPWLKNNNKVAIGITKGKQETQKPESIF